MNKAARLSFSILVLSLVIFSSNESAWADSPAPNTEYVALSPNGQFLIQMMSDDGWGGYGNGAGVAYKLLGQDQREEIWRVDFFSSQVALTSDGRHLIAFGPWATQPTDLAIAFYRDGKLLKSYTVSDLIPDESKLEKTISHFFWHVPLESVAEGLSPDEKTYSLTLIDGSVRVFDVLTGSVLVLRPTPNLAKPRNL